MRIYYSCLSAENHKRILNEFLPNCSERFQRKISKFRRWQDAQLSLLGRILLNVDFISRNQRFHESNIATTCYGKPYIKGSDVKFNIAHSENMVVCAINEMVEVGVDIEVLRNISPKDFRLQMTEGEWARIFHSKNISSSFFDYWTQKESVIKAIGMGLSIPLKSFEIIKNHTTIDGQNYFTKEISINSKCKCYLASNVNMNNVVISPQKVDFY